MKNLYITIAADSEFISDIFPALTDWALLDEQADDDGTAVLLFNFNSEQLAEIEANITSRNDVIGYQII
jgi:hypothetical protein